jgi:hypothetical protein
MLPGVWQSGVGVVEAWDVRRCRVPDPQPEAWTAEEVGRLLAACPLLGAAGPWMAATVVAGGVQLLLDWAIRATLDGWHVRDRATSAVVSSGFEPPTLGSEERPRAIPPKKNSATFVVYGPTFPADGHRQKMCPPGPECGECYALSAARARRKRLPIMVSEARISSRGAQW